MSVRVRAALMSGLGELRHEPTNKRIRAMLGGSAVVDSTRAVLLWEPRRVVPSYAVPTEDIRLELQPAAGSPLVVTDDLGVPLPDVSARPVLDPSVPFGVHTADGVAVDVRAAGQSLPGAGFRLADPDLTGYVVLDFDAFDGWLEEDEPNIAHPRSPFHRIDVLPSSRHVRFELDGEVLADAAHPTLLFETLLPTRYYLRHEDVRAELVPTKTQTLCAHKGQASYWSATVGGRVVPDLAWTYENPLHEAAQVRGLVAFFTERVDLIVDGQRLERPVTPWSPRPSS
jgi:uncharacterized protein (DUF427 family)